MKNHLSLRRDGNEGSIPFTRFRPRYARASARQAPLLASTLNATSPKRKRRAEGPLQRLEGGPAYLTARASWASARREMEGWEIKRMIKAAIAAIDLEGCSPLQPRNPTRLHLGLGRRPNKALIVRHGAE